MGKATLSYLRAGSVQRDMITTFAGLDRRARISEGAWEDLVNAGPFQYPVVSSRPARLNVDLAGTGYGQVCTGLCWNGDALCSLSTNGTLTEVRVDGRISTFLDGVGKRQIVAYGAYFLIFPDGVWINSAERDENGRAAHGELDARVTVTAMNLCTAEGKIIRTADIYQQSYTDDKERQPGWVPASEEGAEAGFDAEALTGKYWVAKGKSGADRWVYKFNVDAGGWELVQTVYERMTLRDHDPFLRTGGRVTMDGWTDSAAAFNGELEVVSTGEDEEGQFLVVMCDDRRPIISQAAQEGGEFKVGYTYYRPKLDFVVQYGGRLWGCRYGVQDGDEVVNEIYGTASGSFVQWHQFERLENGGAGVQSAANSVIFSVGTAGEFTGAGVYGDTVIFFKRSSMFRVYGSESGGWAVSSVTCPGVAPGCAESVCVVGGVLYYMGMTAMYAYDGSAPVSVSAALGGELYREVSCAPCGERLYASCLRAGERELLCLDTVTGYWHRETVETGVTAMCGVDGGLLIGTEEENDPFSRNGMLCLGIEARPGSLAELLAGSEAVLEYSEESLPVEWAAVTGPLGLDTPDKKYLSRVDLRMSMADDAQVQVYIDYDSRGEWELLYDMSGSVLRSFELPVRVRRCDHLRLKISGEGDVKIYSIAKKYEVGSDQT